MLHSSGDRYQRGGFDLVKAATCSAIAFQNSLPDAQRAKKFAKEFAQLTAKFNLKWKKKKLSECKFQQDFPMSKDQVSIS